MGTRQLRRPVEHQARGADARVRVVRPLRVVAGLIEAERSREGQPVPSCQRADESA